MLVIEGRVNGSRISKYTSVSVGNKKINIGGYSSVNLDKVISVDVISQEIQTTTGGGVTGAGAGAVLGFLIAGPVGTAVGAGIGSKKKQQGTDNITIAIGFNNGDSLVCQYANQTDIGKLKVAASKNLLSPAKSEQLPQSSSKNKKTENDEIKILKQPKHPPKWDFELEKIHGKKHSSSTKLPTHSFLSKWKIINNCDKDALNLFNRKCNSAIKDYNNFLWIFYNHTLETEEEFNSISQIVLKNLIASVNKLKDLVIKVEQLKKVELKLAQDLKKLLLELKSDEAELSEKGFFGKGSIKRSIEDKKSSINKIKKKITANKGQITRNSKILDSKDTKEILKIPDLLKKFESIFLHRFVGVKVPSSNFKTIKVLDNQTFLDTYRKHFKTVWEIKLKKDKVERDKAMELIKKKEKEKNIQEKKSLKASNTLAKENLNQELGIVTKSIKERILDLQSLFDEGLITKDEYEIQRQNLIKQI